jgi:hypothetical protein
MDAFLGNKACFLDEEPWRSVMREAISNDESLRDQTELVFILWSGLAHGPGLFKEVTDLIFSPTAPSQAVIDDLIDRLVRDRNFLLCWLLEAQHNSKDKALEGWEDGPAFPEASLDNGQLNPGHITQLALRGTYTMCRILKARLLYALAPAQFQHLEAECQDLAERILDLRDEVAKGGGNKLVDSLFMSQSIWIAEGIVRTREAWSSEYITEDGMIDRWKFVVWCRAIRRKIPTDDEEW